MAGGASGYADDGDGGSISEINVTPLVDIVLVLLIVFMVTMPTIIAVDAMNERELDVRLPQASEAQPLTLQPQDTVVNVKLSGEYVINGETFNREQLAAFLSQAAADNPGRVSVSIRADRNALWDYVVAVMDLCHGAGIVDCRAAVSE